MVTFSAKYYLPPGYQKFNVMSKHISILIFILLYFCSCLSNSSPKTEKLLYHEKQKVIYQFKNDTVLQKVEIINSLSNKIEFSIEYKNLINQKELTFKGVAILVNNKTGNAELGEDENGFAYVVDVYEYNESNCWIYIYIASEEKDKLTVLGSLECKSMLDNAISINSIGILRRQ